MKKICLTLLAVVCAGILFTGCTKKEYSNDLQAETEIFDIKQSDWQLQKDNNNNNYYSFSTNLSSFNNDIHLNGAYWAYISLDNEATYTLLSTSFGDYTYYADFDTDPNNNDAYGVTISAIPADNNTPAPSGTVRIKVVSIPSALLQSNSSVNMKDYNAVKAAFHLKN